MPPSAGIPQAQALRAATWVGLLAGLGALLLFVSSASPGVEWQDPGIHQYRILTGLLEHPLGLALAHPLHYWLGRAMLHVPVGYAPWRLNVMSGIFGAIAVGLLGALVTRLTRSVTAAIFAVVTVSLAHSFWQMSAMTETYTLAAALMLVEWMILLTYARTRHVGWLLALFFVNGLHVADHLLGLLTLAPYGILLLERLARRRTPWWTLPAAGLLWTVGAAPFLVLCASFYAHTGDLALTLHSALFGGAGWLPGWANEVLNTRLSFGQLAIAVLSFGYCFPSAVPVIALLGMLRRPVRRRALFRNVLLAQTVIIVVFVARYSIRDLYTYFVPVCALFALWFGLGVALLLRRWPERGRQRTVIALLSLNAILPLVVYMVFPAMAREHNWVRSHGRDLPFRDEYVAYFRPWRTGDDSAEKFAAETLRLAGPGGWVITDSTPGFALAAWQYLHGGPPGARVYWREFCLTDRTLRPITEADVDDFLAGGGRVVAIPSPEAATLLPGRVPPHPAPDDWVVLEGPPPAK